MEPMVSKTNEKMIELAWLAKLFVGATESGGENKGPLVERFQKAVDRVAVGEPWCMGFVQYIVKAVDDLHVVMLDDADPTRMSATESTVGAYNAHPAPLRSVSPIVGSVVVWQKLGPDKKPIWQGHTGIVVEVNADGIVTVEGNTSQDATTAAKEREGQGVWQRHRLGANIPGFVRLGYLRPWQ